MVDINERKNVIQLIKTYRTLPALWDINHVDYNDYFIKKQQYEILLAKYKETNPNAYLRELKRKINTLRTNYWREVRYLRNASIKGVPKTQTLYYFKELSFLNSIKTVHSNKKELKHTKGKKTSSKDNKIVSIPPNNNIETREIDIKSDLDLLSEKVTLSDKENETEQIETKQEIYKQTHSTSARYQELPSAESRQTQCKDDLVFLPVENYQQKQDLYHSLCFVWSQKLSKMGNNQCLFAEKLINDVLFNGELGLLNISTNISNLSAFQDVPIAREANLD